MMKKEMLCETAIIIGLICLVSLTSWGIDKFFEYFVR